MSKISTYEVTPVPKLADKLIGTSVGGEIEDITYNFTLSELLNLFIPNIPANTLQGVLDYGNEATQDIILNGTIYTTYLEVTESANILNSYLNGETHVLGGLYDSLDSVGTAGQVLRSTGDGVEWYTIPTIIPTLQQVLASGNTADINIVLTANIQAVTVAANNVVSNTSLSVAGNLKDKDASTGTAGQILSSTGTKVQWIDLPIYSATSPLHIDTITKTISIQKAGSTQDGYLSSADWITFSGKQDAISLTTTGSSGPATLVGTTINVPNYTLSGLGGVPLTRTLTINGVTYNLAADRSWTIAAGVSSVTATSPLFSTGGVNPDISIQQAGSSLDGYLSSADWLMFNAKQDAGNYITSLTGEATGSGPGATSVTLSNAAVISKLLTGLNITGGTVVATDSILTAFGKVQNQINGLVGGVIYKGVWNASTNTPTLTSSVGTQGNYYIVNVAGNTNLNGITDWNVGDWAIFNGSTWSKVDNTDAVTSVNGQTGAVSLTTDNIPEGTTNLYFLNSRARAALSFAAGSGAYNSTTGVITIPTNTNQLTNGAAFITLGSLSATSPLSYNNLTGAFSIQVANGTQDGYLSSTDWNTFNSKQAFLNGTGLVKSVAGTISYITDNSTNWNTAYDNMIVSAAVTGTSTKTLTLTQQDAGTITASWTDNGLTSVGVSMPSAFSVSGSPLTSNGTIAITGAGSSLQYIDGTGALQTFPTIANEAATLVTEVYNETGATLTKGTVVYINGGHGNLPTVTKALATSDATSAQTYGVVQVDITNMNNGHVVVIGSLGDLDTQAYPNGTQLYLSSTTAGAWTSVKQYAPAHLVYVGIVVRSHPTQGVVEVKIQNGFEMDELHNVAAQNPNNNAILQYKTSTSLWTSVDGTTTNIAEGTNLYYLDSRARAALSFTPGSGAYNSTTGVITIPTNTNQLTNGAAFITLGSLSVTAPLSYNNLTGVFSISQASATTNGYLSSTDWNTFNSKQEVISLTTTGSSGASTLVGTTLNVPNYTLSGLGGVPTSRTLNINGTSYDLSTDRSWSVGTVTAVAALTLGTTGTDLSSTVATGTTTPVITLNVPTASAANRGALSSADWSTFNTKVGGVTASSPLSSSGGQTPNITIQQASGSQDGYLSSTDWSTFNNKQASGNYITSLTGEATASGPGAAAVTLNNASVTAKVLTGINITGGTVQATDTMLTAFGKLQNQINGLIGSTIYQGTWNASTNTPALASGVGTRGYYYIVSVAGNTNLDGITDWFVGDWAIFDGTAWQQVDNTDAVVSVNGQTGAVSLTTDNIPEGATNQYFLNSRARAALSFAAGSGAYNSTTGVITIPTNNNQITNGANYITLASLSGTAPIQYNNTTGAISITQAGTASNGFLSSTDWNTFNNKQVAGNYVTLDTIQTVTARKTFSDLVTLSAIQVKSGAPTGLFLQSFNSTQLEVGATVSGTTYYSTLTFPGSARAYTFPAASGTIALTSDLSGYVTGSGTINYVARWTSASNIGTGVLQDNGTNVYVGAGTDTASRMTINQPASGFSSPTVLRIENENTTQNESSIRFRAKSSGGLNAHADVGVYATGADTGRFFIKFPWSNSQQVNVKLSITETGIVDIYNYMNINIDNADAYSRMITTKVAGSVGWNLGNNNTVKWGTHIQTTDRFAIFNWGTSSAPLSIDYSTNYIYALQRIGVGTATPSAGVEVNGSGWETGITILTSNVNGADLRLNNQGTGGRDWHITSTGGNNDTGAGNVQFWDATAGLTRFVIKGTSEVGISVNPSTWGSSFRVLQIGQTGSLHQNNTGYETRVSNNMYWDGTNWKYLVTSGASLLNLTAAGGLSYLTAASGTAGTNISLSTVFSVTQTGALTATGDIYVQNSNTSAYSRLWLQNTGASGNWYLIGVGGNTSARANLFYINDATSDLTRLILTPDGQFAMGGQLAGGGALLTLDQNYTQIASPTVLRVQNSNSISQIRIRGINGVYYAHADVGVYADGVSSDTGYWFVKFPYSDGLTNIQLKITQTGAATFSSKVFAYTTGLNSDFNSGAFIAYASGSATKYIQMGMDTTGFGWIQALEQGVAYRNLSINAAGGNVSIGSNTAPAKLTVSGTQVEAHINNGDTNTLALGGFSSGRHFIKSINLGIALTPLTLQASAFTFDTGDVSIGTTTVGNKLRIANGGSSSIPVYIDIAFSGSTPFFGGVQTVRSFTNVPNEGAGYLVSALRLDMSVVEYGGIGVQIESNSNSTWSGKTSLLITENGVTRVPKATLSSQLGFVVNPGLTSSTFSSTGNQSLSGYNIFTAPSGAGWANGGTWAGTVGTNVISFAGSNTIAAGAVVSGFIGVNRISFNTTSLSVTMTQSTGIRALAGMQTLMQTGGSNAGTVSHGASMFIQGVYPTASANITFTNYYGLLINPLDEWGGVTFTNRWGIYQAGSSDRNFFAGIMQKPNQPTFSVKNSAPITINSDAKLPFDSEYFDVGNNYNTSNYRYTIPFSGKYLMTFEASMVSGGAHTYNAIYIVVNGAGTSYRFRGPSNIASGGWFGISGSVVIDLVAGQYVELFGYTDSSSMQIQGSEGCWSGYYLG